MPENARRIIVQLDIFELYPHSFKIIFINILGRYCIKFNFKKMFLGYLYKDIYRLRSAMLEVKSFIHFNFDPLLYPSFIMVSPLPFI